MKTNYEQIVDVGRIGQHGTVDLNEIFKLAEQEQFPAAVNDSPRRLLLCIDVQKDFIEGGALAVPGSIGDVERITQFLYNNMGGITRIMCSLDTHTPHQIFHPCWWANSAGDHPGPYTIITHDDVAANHWRPVIGDPRDSLEYLKELEKVGAGKKQLRKCVDHMIQKGTDPYSEMYGIIKPEYSKKNFLNTPVLTSIEKFDEVYIVGEAASHCLMESVKQIAEHFQNRPEVTQKITVLEDCTSPITGYEADTATAFADFKSTYGIKFAKSTDITL